ncbi:MAG: hypothetical protein WBG43_07175 [Marinifilaceae bacterium]
MKYFDSYITSSFVKNICNEGIETSPFGDYNKLEVFVNFLNFIVDDDNQLYISEDDSWGESNDDFSRIIIDKVFSGGGVFLKDKESYPIEVKDNLTKYSFDFRSRDTDICNIKNLSAWKDYMRIEEYFISKNIDDSFRNINSWEDLKVLNHYSNSFIICDDYLLDSRDGFIGDKARYNIESILSELLKNHNSEEESIDILIIAFFKDFDNSDYCPEMCYWYDYIEDYILKTLKVTNLNLTLLHDINKEIHDRRIINNYFVINSSNSFSNYFKEVNGKIEINIKGLGGEISVHPFSMRNSEKKLMADIYFKCLINPIKEFVLASNEYRGDKINRLLR